MYTIKELFEKVIDYIIVSVINPIKSGLNTIKSRTINGKNIFNANIILKSDDIETNLTEVISGSASYKKPLGRNSIYIVPQRSGKTTFTFPSYHNNGCEYKIIYTKGSGALSLPNTITYNITPNYIEGNTYLIHIIGNYGIITQLTNNS